MPYLGLSARNDVRITTIGSANLDGSVVVNESSADKDFRVESDGNTHMLFVNGGNNCVGIGNASPTYALDIKAGTNTNPLRIGLTTDGYGYTAFQNSSGDVGYIGLGGGAAVGNGNANTFAIRGQSELRFATNGNNEALLLDTSQNATFAGSVTANAVVVDNITIDGNDISTTNTNGNLTITPNGTGDLQVNSDRLEVKAASSESSTLLLKADNHAGGGDAWRMVANTDHTLVFQNDISGSDDVTHFSITPNATVANSTATFAGKATFGSHVSVKGGQAYASSATNLATTVSKKAFRMQGSSDASTSLWMGALANDAQMYIQACNDAGDGVDDIVLNPFGGKVGIGVGNSSPDHKLEILGANGNQLKLNNGSERFTQLTWCGNDAQKGAIWYDSTNTDFVVNTQASVDFVVQTGGSNERFKIDSSGTSYFTGGIVQSGGQATFNSGGTNTVATFTSTDSVAEIQMTDNNGTAGISAEGDTFQVRPAGGAAKLSVDASMSTFATDLRVHSGTNAALQINDNIGEVGSGNIAIQAQNTAASALKPLGLRGEDIRFATGSAERMRINDNGVGIGNSHTPAQYENFTVVGDYKSQFIRYYASGNRGYDIDIGARDSSGNFIIGAGITGEVRSGDTDGDLVFKTRTSSSLTEKMRIHANGNVKIGQNLGTLLDNCPLQIEREESSNDSCIRTKNPSTNGRFHFDFWNSSGTQGNITVNASSVNFNSTSDYRKKENVNYDWDGTTEIKKLKPAKFNFIGSSDTIQGFLAHEVSSVVPIAVTGEKDAMRDERYEVSPVERDSEGNVTKEAVMGTRSVPSYQSIDQSKLVPLLVKTIQELEARIAKLEE